MTGGGRGIGGAVSLALAEDGADVAVVRFLVSDAARYVTGERIYVDGGGM